MRGRKPQVELYFDDGSMLAMPGDAAEAAPFMAVADARFSRQQSGR